MVRSVFFPYFVDEAATFTQPTQDLLAQHGDIVSALCYGSLFFPDFLEVDDSVFLSKGLDELEQLFQEGKIEGRFTLAELEASFNTVEVGYLFRTDDGTEYDAVEEKLAGMIAEAWTARLKKAYPTRQFSVSILTPDVSGSCYHVEFFEIRPGSK